MRTHEDDLDPLAPRHPTAKHDQGEELSQRALAAGRPGSLDTPSVMHLQRAAGNASVNSFLAEEEGRSPVLDVVGSGGGQPLDHDTRAQMEASFGHDFSDVRIHTGQKASESAKSVHAQAYTVGNDIVFQGDNYSSGTAVGNRMLAHELTHVLQQRSGPVEGTPAADGVSISHPSDRFEQAAEKTADRVISRQGTNQKSPGSAASLQRQEDAGVGERVIQRQGVPPEEERGEENPEG